MNKKKKQELHAIAWDKGFLSGVYVGMLDAIGVLTQQQEKYGNVAGIEDLKQLIADDAKNIRERYED